MRQDCTIRSTILLHDGLNACLKSTRKLKGADERCELASTLTHVPIATRIQATGMSELRYSTQKATPQLQ